jgi:predicted AlkP superfamily pyrophosphatase or phosphodiesterase
MASRLFAAGAAVLLVLASACQGPELTATGPLEARQADGASWAGENAPEHDDAPYVLLISLDGYRHDYTALYGPENLTRFAAEGVQATSLIPAFPSDTFPNHYGIVTGMFPGTHGIVANSFFDRERSASYQIGNAAAITDGTWYGGTPIWSAAVRSGMVAASYFWIGSEAGIAGFRPTYATTYDGGVPHSERISQVLEWLSFPERYRPHFVTLYFSSVDTAGHGGGPASDGVRNAVLGIDRDLGVLFDGLRDVEPEVNVFIVSDHGMVDLDPAGIIDIDARADLRGLRAVNLGSKVFLYGEDPGRIEDAYRQLEAGQDHYRVFRSGDTPDAWHAENTRFGDIIVAADAPYTLVRGGGARPDFPAGAHGYDPYLFPEVRGIFYARGPDLRSEGVIPAFSNVHVYPLIMDLLGLESPPGTDGRLEVLEEILNR